MEIMDKIVRFHYENKSKSEYLMNTVKSRNIGYLTPFNEDSDKPVGQQTNFLRECIREAKKLNIAVTLFTPRALKSSSDETCIGFQLNGDQWEKVVRPIPMIFYDRFYSTIQGFDPVIEVIKDQLREKYVLFNPVPFARCVTSKLSFAKKIKEFGFKTPGILAESLESTGQLTKLFQQEANIILKPVFGRMGRGIIRIKRRHNRFNVMVEQRCVTVTTPEELMGCIRWIGRQSGLNTTDYLVQKTIELPSYKQRCFDIRSLVQRIDSKTMNVTGNVVRVSAGGTAVPNLDRGGLAMDPLQWLKLLWRSPVADDVYQRLNELSLKVYRSFESEYGLICEMGIDYLIDRDRRIWIIEINSKPGRMAFLRLGSGFGLPESKRRHYRNLRLLSVRNPMKFADRLIEIYSERETT